MKTKHIALATGFCALAVAGCSSADASAQRAASTQTDAAPVTADANPQATDAVAVNVVADTGRIDACPPAPADPVKAMYLAVDPALLTEQLKKMTGTVPIHFGDGGTATISNRFAPQVKAMWRAYFEEQMTSLGIAWQEMPFPYSGRYKTGETQGHNVEAVLPGVSKDSIVVIVHYDSVGPRGTDNPGVDVVGHARREPRGVEAHEPHERPRAGRASRGMFGDERREPNGLLAEIFANRKRRIATVIALVEEQVERVTNGVRTPLQVRGSGEVKARARAHEILLRA